MAKFTNWKFDQRKDQIDWPLLKARIYFNSAQDFQKVKLKSQYLLLLVRIPWQQEMLNFKNFQNFHYHISLFDDRFLILFEHNLIFEVDI